MRTTIRLDDELMMELKKRSRKEKVSLTKLVNQLLRRGLEASGPDRKASRRHRERVFTMGTPAVDLDKALALASALEDEESLRKVSLRK
jgi:Arc/MetJ family transcription regulator